MKTTGTARLTWSERVFEHNGFMALLVTDQSRIEGPQRDVLHVLLESLIRTLRQAGQSQTEAEEIAHRQLIRAQVKLAQAGYVVRDLE